MHIGQQIIEARQAAGVGRYTLARELGISAHTMIKIEESGWTARPQILQQIADLLGCELRITFAPDTAGGVQ